MNGLGWRHFRGIFLAAVLLPMFFIGAAPVHSVVPPYELLHTRNGVPVYFFPNKSIPLFEVHLVFDGGSDMDPPELSGLGMFSASLIRRGVPGLDEDAISAKLDDVAGGVDVGVDEDNVAITSYGLDQYAKTINEILFAEVSHPTFPSKPFKRLKNNHIDSILQLPDSPGALASHVLDVVLFNKTTKARPGEGLKREVIRIRLQDLKKYYPRLIRTDRLRVLVVGGRDHREVLDQVVAGVEALPCEACGQKDPELKKWDYPRWNVPPGNVLLVPRPGVSEAHIRMGFIGPKRDVPEFYDLRVAEAILSGYYASRLNMVIREKLGLTYGINAGFTFGRDTGVFEISTSTRNEKTGELITQVNGLLKKFVEGDVSAQELRMSKDFLVGSFPLGLQNMYVIASTFFTGLMKNLDPGFMDEYPSRVNAVTEESLRAAVKKYFTLDLMKTIVVGDRKEVAPRLTKSKLGFVVHSADDYL